MITFFLQNSFSVVLSYNWLPIKTIYYNIMTVWLDFLFHFEGLDVWWYLRNHSMLSCWSHLQKEKSVQVENWCQCCQEKLNPTGWSLDGRIQELLLWKIQLWSGMEFWISFEFLVPYKWNWRRISVCQLVWPLLVFGELF